MKKPRADSDIWKDSLFGKLTVSHVRQRVSLLRMPSKRVCIRVTPGEFLALESGETEEGPADDVNELDTAINLVQCNNFL